MRELERIEKAKENFQRFGVCFKPKQVQMEEMINRINHIFQNGGWQYD